MDIDKDKKVFAQANGWIMNFSSSNSSDMAKKKIKSCAFCKNFTCCSPYGYDYACILECVKSLSMKFVRILRDKKQCLGRLNEPKF